MKILIIDDDVLFAQYLQSVLKKYDSKICANVVTAIDEIVETVPDLIILDILMPGVNGLTLLNELISYDFTRDIPIILCSSVADKIKKADFKQVKAILDKTTMVPIDIITAVQEAVNE